jgi:hypothetical protein
LLIVDDERLLAGLIERTARLYHDQAPLAGPPPILAVGGRS